MRRVPLGEKTLHEQAAHVLWDRRDPGTQPDVSFIVPCKNEERYLRACLESLVRFGPENKRSEIILVDNGSTDNSINIAEEVGVDAALTHRGRIGHGRNIGARAARAPLLIFIDADVSLSRQWQERANARWSTWTEAVEEAVWGSWYSIRTDGTWVEKAWFAPLRFGPKTHMNGGHLIMRAPTFWQTGGFPPELETGEDYELSVRARALGLEIDNDELLEAVHLGYPRTVRAFFARELWHGRGDVSSVAALLRSKTALTSLVAVHALPLAVLGIKVGAWLPPAAVAVASLLSVALVLRTFGRASANRFIQKLVLGLVYIAGRGLAPYGALMRAFSHKQANQRRKSRNVDSTQTSSG